MGRKATPKQEAPQEPKITYDRHVTLTAVHPAQFNLGHLADLVRQARDRGYGDDATVRVFDYRPSSFLYGEGYTSITVGDDR